jgi:hypothetical protein
MPKALSPLQSDQRSYTSEFSVGSCWSFELAVEGVGIQGKRKGTYSLAATRIVLATDATRVVAVDTVTAKLVS